MRITFIPLLRANLMRIETLPAEYHIHCLYWYSRKSTFYEKIYGLDKRTLKVKEILILESL